MKFSAIIPAYNEWPRILGVLQTVCESEKVDEVIAVDDGSTDNTRKMIENFSHSKVRKIFLAQNGGKARAVLEGVRQATGDFIVMIDSDLIGLKPHHIDMLIEPIVQKKSDVTLSIRENSLGIYKFFGTDFVSGERVIPKTLFADGAFFTDGKGFWLEVKMNQKILEQGYKIQNIFLAGVSTPRKSAKVGAWKGFFADMKMISEILSTVSLWELVRQFWKFSRFGAK